MPGRGALVALVESLKRRRLGIPANLGDLRRATPINTNWGRGRGKPIDRVYIERFLDEHRTDIRGRALEVLGSEYVHRFGNAIEHVDVLDLNAANPRATIVADLADASEIPSESFDCVVLTQVLQYLFDLRAALSTVRRVLAPGGVLLATVPGITRSNTNESDLYGDWWRFTSQGVRRVAAEVYGSASVEVISYGSVLTAAGFLYGLGSDDFSSAELALRDPDFEVVVALRATKA